LPQRTSLTKAPRRGEKYAADLKREWYEDRVDAVVAKPLRELVRDDVRDALGHPVVARLDGSGDGGGG
jgi:hypothetical protein